MTFERVTLVALVLGIWALVLAPEKIAAEHHIGHGGYGDHYCMIAGNLKGWTTAVPLPPHDFNVVISDLSKVVVACKHVDPEVGERELLHKN